jgi:hypothetical protein
MKKIASEIPSKTLKLSNAYVTLHKHSPGTFILNVTTHKGDSQHVAVWVGPVDMRELAALLVQESGPADD